MSERIVLTGGVVATVDEHETEYPTGYVVIEGDRIVAVGGGAAPDDVAGRRVDTTGCLVTPGLVNAHHHLYQWAYRGLATDSTLFDWLVTLYPAWSRMDADVVHAASVAGLARLALTGATTSTDHHYLFPAGRGDLFGAGIAAAREVGLRFHPTRGSMDRGESDGGLPPDEAVERTADVLDATAEAIERHHDPAPGAMLRVGVAPCSPFSVTSGLLTRSAELARRYGVRLHTHLAETSDEERQCLAEHGCTPTEYLESVGWLGTDVWFAHTVHLTDDNIKRLADTGSATAHCPSSNGRLGAGISPVREMLDAGVSVGLGVDGPASNEDGGLVTELRQAVLTARGRGGPTALRIRQALRMATAGGAECLGRADDLGSLSAGRLADVAVWRIDGLDHAGIADPVAALVLGAPPPVETLLVGGRPVVEHGSLRTVSPADAARSLARQSARMREGERR